MGAKANPHRRADIQAALKRAKPDTMLSLEELAFVWGTTKGPFVTAKKYMVGMPAPVLSGTSHLYPAKDALRAMLNYETRNDEAARNLAERQAAILGMKARSERAAEEAAAHSPRDLQVLNRLAAEVEEREREQRQYIPAAEVAKTAGDVFSELSEFMAGLSNAIDPNGLLDPKLRELIDHKGGEALLSFHRKLKTLLDADAIDQNDRAADDRARKPRARRTRH